MAEESIREGYPAPAEEPLTQAPIPPAKSVTVRARRRRLATIFAWLGAIELIGILIGTPDGLIVSLIPICALWFFLGFFIFVGFLIENHWPRPHEFCFRLFTMTGVLLTPFLLVRLIVCLVQLNM